MKRNIGLTLLTIATLAISGDALGQVAGSSTLGVAAEEAKDAAMGWSAKKQVLNQPVYNEKDEKVGKVDDLIVSPDKKLSYAIVGAGGFAGIGKHDVAIPLDQLKEQDGKIILPGATKEAVKAMPEFEYAK